jgi:glutamine synthetase
MNFCLLGHRFQPIKHGLKGEETDRLIPTAIILKNRRNMFKNSAEIFAYIKKEDVKFIDVRFTDLPGIQHHFNVPVESFDEAVFTDGLMFDGSSIRGFQSIHESDMKLLPVPSSAFLDPFRDHKTLVIIFSVHNPVDNSAYSRDPRGVVAKAVDYMRSLGFADTAFFAPEAEFYVFDSVRFKTGINEAYHEIQSYEGAWNTGVEVDADGTPNRGYRTRIKGGYFPVSPTDQFADLRDEMVMELGRAGLLVERSHHEVGTAGQMEINYRFSDILQAGDDVMKFKYIIRNVAWEGGKTATFMPKPLFGDNGSGMHVHQSL